MSRENILIKTSWISTIGNAILSASKIIIGLWTGSLAVVGDGIDSATDVVISIVMIFTARLINRPPSKKYVFGYEKAEGIATKILSLVIFYAGVQMLISSIQSIFSDEVKEIPSSIAIYVTVFSIIGKLLLALYQYKQGKKINSSMLTANAINMRNDVVISTGVLLGLIFTQARYFQTAFKLKKAQFDYQVNKSIDQVIDYVEEYERRLTEKEKPIEKGQHVEKGKLIHEVPLCWGMCSGKSVMNDMNIVIDYSLWPMEYDADLETVSELFGQNGNRNLQNSIQKSRQELKKSLGKEYDLVVKRIPADFRKTLEERLQELI